MNIFHYACAKRPYISTFYLKSDIAIDFLEPDFL